jgi:hypothetical protein
MVLSISSSHKKRFEEIKRNLPLIGYKEDSFSRIELLFFEVLTISRSYGEDPDQNPLLAELKRVHTTEYKRTTEATRKSRQREVNIKHFVMRFKKLLAQSISSAAR